MIPLVIHFIWVSLNEQLPELFKLCILSAVVATKCKVVLHTDDPSIVLPGVETRLREFPKMINGVDFDPNEDVKHHFGRRVSHLKDVVRLQILHEEGGIYSDLDVLWLRHPWFLMDYRVVIGYQAKAYRTLCNAVMMAEPGHEAIKDYLDWTISIYPPRKYWIPANPFRLWRSKEYLQELTYVERSEFFGRAYTDDEDYMFHKLYKATAIHLYYSIQKQIGGEVIETMQKRIQAELGVTLPKEYKVTQ